MTLYQLDNRQALRSWAISLINNTIVVEHGLYTGRKQVTREVIAEGLAGRTIQEQIDSRVNSRINKQLDKGYRHTIEEAQEFAHTNSMNFYKPMLAQQFNKQKSVDTTDAVIQRKLDGNRMLATRQNGEIICYTRNGKPITTLGHIIDDLGWLNEGQTVDGEIYIHGMALKDINSRIRKKQSGTIDLVYHIYDTVTDDPFKVRYKELVDQVCGRHTNKPSVALEPTWYMDELVVPLNELFKMARKDGYEGLMMRLPHGYESGKRSKNLLKIKERYDAEYEVISVELAKNGSAILVLKLPNGKIVKGVAPGSLEAKRMVAAMPDAYIGKLVTCSFAYLTDFGIPFHLTCDRWK